MSHDGFEKLVEKTIPRFYFHFYTYCWAAAPDCIAGRCRKSCAHDLGCGYSTSSSSSRAEHAVRDRYRVSRFPLDFAFSTARTRSFHSSFPNRSACFRGQTSNVRPAARDSQVAAELGSQLFDQECPTVRIRCRHRLSVSRNRITHCFGAPRGSVCSLTTTLVPPFSTHQ